MTLHVTRVRGSRGGIVVWTKRAAFRKPFATAPNLYFRPVVCQIDQRASYRQEFSPSSQQPTGTAAATRNTWREQMRRASLGLVLALTLVHVSCTGTTKSGGGSTPPAQIAVSVTPTAANVRAGAGQPFTATVTGTKNQSVTWSVNGVVGGNASVGLITNAGLYTAPAILANPNTITISATSAADSSASSTSDVTLWNATPVLSNVSPATFTSGAYTLTVTGSKFVSGAQVLFGGAAVTTSYVSATKLTATGSAPSAGIFAVTVSNPNPGSSSSGVINVTVTSQSGFFLMIPRPP